MQSRNACSAESIGQVLQWPVLARSRELHPCGLVLCPTFLSLFLGRHVLLSGVPCNVSLAGISAHTLSPASQGRHLCAQAKQGTTSIGLPCMRNLTITWATLLKVAMSSADDNSSEPFKSRNSQLENTVDTNWPEDDNSRLRLRSYGFLTHRGTSFGSQDLTCGANLFLTNGACEQAHWCAENNVIGHFVHAVGSLA
jgi:hypothetical protein